MSLGVESEQDTEIVVSQDQLIETVDREGFVVLLPNSIDAVNGYWTNDNAPNVYMKLDQRPFDGISFKIKINRDFSNFTHQQKLEAVGKIVSEWRTAERISLTVSNFTKEELDMLVQAYLKSK